MYAANEFFQKALEKRKQNNSLRTLVPENSLIDFCSTDYLGFARSEELRECILVHISHLKSQISNLSGSTGSRLMRGNYSFTGELEKKIAAHHKSEAALIFNSGYDANVGLFSCVPQRGDIILHDELIHVSSRDGMRLSLAKNYSFRHNDVQHLENKLIKFSVNNKSQIPQKATPSGGRGHIFVAVESVYSMDGDFSPLKVISELCKMYNAHLIVDEAHATGIFGKYGEGRVVELGLEKKVFAVVHTFGKGLGCHGAAILGSNLLHDFLINFSHSFIYSTAIPPLNIIAMECAYSLLKKSNDKIIKIKYLITLFKEKIKCVKNLKLIESESPIQCIIIQGNEVVKSVAKKINENGYDVRAVLSPTVPKGTERLRICLHVFNTEEEIAGLVDTIKKIVTTQ